MGDSVLSFDGTEGLSSAGWEFGDSNPVNEWNHDGDSDNTNQWGQTSGNQWGQTSSTKMEHTSDKNNLDEWNQPIEATKWGDWGQNNGHQEQNKTLSAQSPFSWDTTSTQITRDDLHFMNYETENTTKSKFPPQQQYSAPPTPPPESFRGADLGLDDEEPLLDELGINFEHIKEKTLIVLNPRAKIDPDLMENADMAGPFLFCISLGFFLMLSGKNHFDYIYSFGGIGCVGMYGLLNLMDQNGIDLYRTVSILGYSLLPMMLLACSSVFFPLNGTFGFVFSQKLK
jgi:protein YIPF5/7